MTRCEAYLDSKGILRCYKSAPPPEQLESREPGGEHPLKGKKIYIPPMAYGSARAFAAGFRAIGLDAEPTPPSDHRTRELGARYTSGDECYPAKVTVGDFMKLLERPGIDPSRTVLFMPTAEGPCRFGQYAPYLRHILDANGYEDIEILAPSSKNAYQGLGEPGRPVRAHRMARAAAPPTFCRRSCCSTGPSSAQKGETEAVYEECLDDLCRTHRERAH